MYTIEIYFGLSNSVAKVVCVASLEFKERICENFSMSEESMISRY
jgi:hypothetical protein